MLALHSSLVYGLLGLLVVLRRFLLMSVPPAGTTATDGLPRLLLGVSPILTVV